ncbi:MAG: DUF4347 domain-containing protein, partial [Planctomycetota bacterium]
MKNIKHAGWFKSLFGSKSRRSQNGRLSVEHLEVRLTPDAKAMPAFHDLAIGISENKCAANSITLVDDIRLQQNSTDYRSSQVYFCSNDTSDFSSSPFQLVHKLDDVALQAAATKGVVLIDSSLIATIPVDELKGSLVVSIDSNFDVVSQITTALKGLANVPVLRVISHGNDGVLWFGNQAFDSTVLTASAMQVASWGSSLTADADILLYGCSIANTDAGKAFVEQFASITQADIGASTNLTGKAGDEVLEFQVGQVSNSLIASAIDYESANLSLPVFHIVMVTTTADSGPGSLRQAITDTNATLFDETISFASSMFTNGANTITLQSALPDIKTQSLAGALTITRESAFGGRQGTATITGPDDSTLNISGNNGDIYRNFNIFNIDSGGSLSISGLTVSGAQTSDRGGAFNNSGTLTVSNSTISGNTAGHGGGGIVNYGTLNVSNSTLSGNSANGAFGSGGGIFNNNVTTVINSTIFGNSSSYNGGGIYNKYRNGGSLTLTNCTISDNSVINTGTQGGGVYNSGTLNISNTIIANSTISGTSGGDYDGSGTIGTNLNNLLEDGSITNASSITTGSGNISGDPNLGLLLNNGGPTFTMALLSGSAAIGAGNATISNAAPINGLDQRGINRTTSDIGAYSFGIQVTNTGDSNTAGSGSLRAAINLANTTAGNDGIGFNLTGASSFTIALTSGTSLPTILYTFISGGGFAGGLTINGLGASLLNISGNNSLSTRNFNIFNIASGGNLSIFGATISGAITSGSGSAFYNSGSLTVGNSTISGNKASYGGGIENLGILTVTNSTLFGNKANYGGGIDNYGSLTVTNSTLSGNTAAFGGGIVNAAAGTLTVSNSTLSGNAATNGGGAIENNGTTTISISTISNNSAKYGGGIRTDGTFTVSNSTISDNKATFSSGGVENNFGTFSISNSTISGNTANQNGGGVENNFGTLNISQSILSGNAAINGGGAIENNGATTVSNSTISNNSAKYGGGIRTDDTLTISSSTLSNNKATTGGGGGIENNLGTLTITNSTLFGNTANQDGGGIRNIATLNLRNSTIVGNSANNGGGTFNSSILNIANTIIANSTKGNDYTGNGKVNLIGSSTAANNLVTQSGLNPWASAVTSAQLNLGDLQNNGGPTFTMALGVGSVAINAGNAIISRTLPVRGLDQRGFKRITPDIGAFNNSAPTLTTILPLIGATEDTPFSITYAALVAASDVSDAEGDPVSFRIESVDSGTLTKNGVAVVAGTTLLSAGQTLVWTAAASNANGILSAFTVKAFDGLLASAPAIQVSVNIAAVNNAPVAIDDSISLMEDTTYSGKLRGYDVDIGSSLTYLVETRATKGVVTITDAAKGAFKYVPNLNANGSDTFTFTVNDGTISSAMATVIVNILPKNTAPTLTTISTLTGASEGIPYTITYATLVAAANEADTEGNAISFRIESVNSGTLTKNGVAVVAGITLLSAGESLIYTASNFGSTLNAFAVKAFDGLLSSATAVQVTLNVAAITEFNFSTSNSTITITGYTGTDWLVNIPSTIGGLPVTSIGGGAFYNIRLTSITIPNSVTSIGDWAFVYCYDLTSITVDASNATYSSLDGVLYDKTQTTIL